MKKKCEMGSSCPYQNEYQHQLEFIHDSYQIESKKKSFPAFVPFKGKSYKLSNYMDKSQQDETKLHISRGNLPSVLCKPPQVINKTAISTNMKKRVAKNAEFIAFQGKRYKLGN